MTSKEALYKLYLQHPLISTDTRKISAGSLFFALKGEKFDANTFARQAIEAGASYAIIDNAEYNINEQYILVDDVLTALQDLARFHRNQLTIPIVGLTGSNGKTTTKELINSVLSQRYKTLATQGNLNNHIGVPLTILKIDKSHEIAVIEMGANHQKEIEFLCSISQPTHGLITNVGKAHLEGFGGVEGVKKGKGELYDYLRWKVGKLESWKVETSTVPAPQGVAFINNDNSVLSEMAKARDLNNVVFYGTGAKNNLITGKIIDNSPLLTIGWVNNKTGKNHTVKTQLTGAYNLDNVLAAVCIGVYFDLTDAEINKGIESYLPQNNRSQIVQTETNTLICDYYNANPSSMFVAIENMNNIKAKRKVLILGDMFELGVDAAAEHAAVIKKAMDTAVDERIFIGAAFYHAFLSEDNGPWTMDNGPWTTGKKNTVYPTTEDAIKALTTNPVKNSTILIKGSRGMALERLVGLF